LSWQQSENQGRAVMLNLDIRLSARGIFLRALVDTPSLRECIC